MRPGIQDVEGLVPFCNCVTTWTWSAVDYTQKYPRVKCSFKKGERCIFHSRPLNALNLNHYWLQVFIFDFFSEKPYSHLIGCLLRSWWSADDLILLPKPDPPLWQGVITPSWAVNLTPGVIGRWGVPSINHHPSPFILCQTIYGINAFAICAFGVTFPFYQIKILVAVRYKLTTFYNNWISLLTTKVITTQLRLFQRICQ